MNNKEQLRSYIYKGITAFVVVAAGILFFFLIFRVNDIFGYIKKIIDVLQPIVFGLVIAYFVNPIANFVSHYINKLILGRAKNRDRAQKISEISGVFIGLIIFLAIIVAVLVLVIPQFINSISNLVTELPAKLDVFATKIMGYVNSNQKLEEYLLKILEYEKHWLQTDLAGYVSTLAANFASGLLNVITFLKNIVVGLIVTVYVLLSKRSFANKTRKLLCAIFKIETVKKIIGGVRKSHSVFSGFISGKLLDSFIIGILCFVGVTALRIPYAMLIAVTIGVTNIIPIFGPFIGAIPCAALVLLTNPLKGLYFIIFIILLQILDGNVIGPKILGDKTGLETFWVVFAIVLGGGLFGVLGMILGVPAFAVIFYFAVMMINNKLRKKGLPVASDVYTAEYFEDQEEEGEKDA